MSPPLISSAPKVKQVNSQKIQDLAPYGYGPLKNSAPQLPTVSKSFFFKSHSAVSEHLTSSYIFFDPDLKLDPYPICARDFVTPPQTPPPQSPAPSLTPGLTVTPSSVAISFKMTKPEIDRNEKNYTTFRAIKEKITLTPGDFKELQEAAAEFVKENEEACKKVPRVWRRQNWKDVAHRFIDTEGIGDKFWSKDREGFTFSDDLSYPEDKHDIAFLSFAILRQESEKRYRTGKRKSSPGADGDDEASPASAKKAKSAKVVPVNDDETSEEGEEAEKKEHKHDGSTESDNDAAPSESAEKAKANDETSTPKVASSQATASKSAATEVDEAAKGDASAKKTKPAKAPTTPKPKPAAKKDASTTKSTAKKTPAKKKKVAFKRAVPADESSATDEEEKTGETVAGKSIVRGDPFQTARAFSQDPAFSRESLLGKSGVMPGQPDGEEPTYELPTIVDPPHLNNDYFGIFGVEQAARGDVLMTALEGRGATHAPIHEIGGQGPRSHSPSAPGFSPDIKDEEGSTVLQPDISNMDMDVTALGDSNLINNSPAYVASPETPNTGGFGDAQNLAYRPVVHSSDGAVPAHTPPSSEFSSLAAVTSINYSVTIATGNPMKEQIPQLINLSARAAFTDLLSQVKSLYANDTEFSTSVDAATACIVTLRGTKPFQRQLNLKSDGLDSSWRGVVKKLTGLMVDAEDDEVELEFR